MPEFKDPAIKLFGKTIQLTHLDHKEQHYCSRNTKKTMVNDDPKTPTPDKEIVSKNTTKMDNTIGDSNPEEKPQKPDKILACPRCNSMDTKFCYYNNYNVNQPRHFCKNCQRYWTAGGTMRNTPVGSGRRKNKSLSSASYYRHLIVSDTGLKNNGTVLSFGSELPHCEPNKSEEDCSSSGGNCDLMTLQKCPVQIPCFPSHPLCNPWNSAQFRPPANLFHSGFPANFYWNMPMPMPLMNPSSQLGKHSRDGNLLPASSNFGNEEPLKDKDSETLRINDPNKAAKSSSWSNLGISKDENRNNSMNVSVFSKAFQSKIDESNEVVGSSLANLQANPAALSRSLNFRETS